MKKILAIIFVTSVLTTNLFAEYSGWQTNWGTGESGPVDVTFNGSEMEVYNYNSGEYEYHDIDSRSGSSFETYNYSTGTFSTIDLD